MGTTYWRYVRFTLSKNVYWSIHYAVVLWIKSHWRFGIKYYWKREKLEKFKHKSNHDLKKFNIILSNYSESEQRQIKRYQRDDVLADESLILRICEDISNIDSKDKNNRNTAIQEEIKADKERRRAEGKARKERIKARMKRARQEKLLKAN